MIDLAGGNLVVLAALLVGLAGGLVILGCWRWRLRRGVGLGVVICILGYGALGLLILGAIPASYLVEVDRRLRPSLKPDSSIDSTYADRLLREAELGVLSDAEFTALLTANTPNRSVGSRGGAMITLVEHWIRTDRLGERYVDLTVDWLIKSWPKWEVTESEVDDVPGAVLGTSHLPAATRDRFVDFLLARIGDPKQAVSHGWYEAMDRLALAGELDATRLSTYVAHLAGRQIVLVSKSSEHWRGDWASCVVVNPAGPGTNVPSSRLPISGSIKLRHTGIEFPDGELGLPSHFGAEGAELARVVVPDTPGTHRLIADVEVELTHNALRSHFQLNPHYLSARNRIKGVPEVRAQKQLTLDFVVADKQALAPELVVGGADLAGQVSKSVLLPQWLASVWVGADGVGRCSGNIQVNRPPVTLVMDVIWIIDGKEHVVGWFAAEEGKEAFVHYGGDVGNYRGGTCTMMLRPNLEKLKKPRGVGKVYDGPPVSFTVQSYTR